MIVVFTLVRSFVGLLKDRKNECCETFKKWIKYKFKMVNLRIENSMGVTGWWGGGWWVAENFQLSYDHGRANPVNPYGHDPPPLAQCFTKHTNRKIGTS